MNGTRRRRVISTSRPARSVACCSLSMTQGPAMRTSGLPPPTERSPSLTGVTPSIVSSHRLGGARDAVRGVRGLVLVRGRDERREQRMRTRRLRLEFRMELHGEVPRMTRQLRNLDELAVGRSSRDAQAVLGQRALVEAVELVAMTVALVDERRAVYALRQRSWRQLARVRAKPHGAAQVVDAEQIAQLVDDLGRRIRVALGRIGVAETGDVAGVLHRRPLEPVADAEIGNAALARDL